MTDLQLTFLPYTLQYKKSFITSKNKITRRKGFIITLKDPDGIFGVGDAAPFPEFGSEKFETTERVLKNLKLKLKIDFNNISQSINKNLSPFEKYPALRHGLEQSILNLICKQKGISLDKLLNKNSKRIINVNAVMGMLSPKKSVSEALRFIDEGYSTLKIKIGRDDFNKDLKVIVEIKKAVEDNIKIRVDVNGIWRLNEAKKYLKVLKDFQLEYIEQPVKRIDNLIKLNKLKKVPIAADESCRNIKEAEELIKRNAVSILILKPMMLGGIVPTLKIIDKAEKKNIKCVVTSSFESAVGRTLAIFAASVLKGDNAHGFGTAQYFVNDIIEDPFPVKEGKIYLYN